MKLRKIQLFSFLLLSAAMFQTYAQVSNYADTGNGNHKDDILWLTWSGTGLADGIHENDQAIFNMPLGGTITATFTQVSVNYPIADSTPSDGEDPDGYLPADIKTWCGATLYTAYDLSGSSSEVLFSDVSATTGLGNGENGQDIAFKITYNMTINGYTIPVDVITGDPESVNSTFSESINVQTNTNNWELIENIRGTNYGLTGLGTTNITITEAESGTACSGGVNSGSNSSPLLMAKGITGIDTELDFDLPFPTGDGHEGVIFGLLLPFDQGDAPATYGVASHLQIKNATGPGLINDSQLYLGTVKGDSDYHANNPLFSTNADGDNNDDNNDEDGLTNLNYPYPSDTAVTFTLATSDITLNNTTGSTAQLHSWIDIDGNGTFNSDEYATSTVPNGAVNPASDLNFTVPTGLDAGNYMVRLRLTTDNTLNSNTPTGAAIDGEVEDFQISLFYPSASVDFDGIDDYISVPGFTTGFPEVTMMAWVKIDPSNVGSTNTILGEDVSCRIILSGTNSIQFSIRTTTSPTSAVSDSYSYDFDEWHHLTGTFNGITGEQKLYIDGELANSAMTGFTGTIQPTAFSNGNFEIGKHARASGDQEFFAGLIDEVRVFNKALTEDQVQQIVYQEIENNGGLVKGVLINKDIQDRVTSDIIPWTNLQAYFPMSDVINSKTSDDSNYSREATLHNITTYQRQTAPMPYETFADGAWATESTWLHGDVWDIEDVATNKDWSIVHIKNNITTATSHMQLGMFIDSGNSLTVSGDNSISNSWYLQLDGTLDLADDSQLLQGTNSDLVTSATGNILRRQEGNSSVYWYNYWSSPVGSVGTTTLTNNNGTNNNTNNSAFNISMLKDGLGNPFSFTNSFDNPGNISDRWLYSYLNGQTFWDWTTLTPSTPILPGVGYTQKGTGNAGAQQQYIFDGKPNNGTILIQADDVDGDTGNESEQDVTLTTTFIGNPYPSAIDARQFISDNSGVTGGSVYVWEQWGGTNHILEEYQGGYGTINLTTTEKAYQFNDPTQTESPLARKPTFYIPVAQGFFVEVVNDGNNAVLSTTDDIEFNNGQRVFIKESDADGTDPNNGSEFFRNSNQTEEESDTAMMRLELNVSNGNSRSFVLAFSDQTTDGFDYGYDARTIDPQNDDMNSFIDGQKMLIQAFSSITEDKVIDLMFNSTGTYDYTLEIIELNGFDESQDIYLRDNYSNTYFDLRNGTYSFDSDISGEDTERFDIVFKNDQTLSTSNDFFKNAIIYVNTIENKLFVKGLNQDAKSIILTNMLGQTVKSIKDVSNQTMENGISIQNLSSGIYLVKIKTEDNNQLSKKIILE